MQRNNISFALLLVLVLMLVCISMQDEITVTTEQPAKDTSNVEKPVQQQESTSAKEQATTTATKQTFATEQEDDDDDSSDLSPLLFAAPRFPSLLSTLFHNSDMWNMDSDFDSLFHDEDFFGLNRYRYRRPSLFTTLRNQMLRRARAAQACQKKQQQQQEQAVTKPEAADQVQIKHIKVSSEWFEDADAYKITITVPSTVTQQQQEQVHLQWNKQKRVLQLRVGTNAFEKEYRFVKPIRSKGIVAQWNTNQQLIITVPKKPTPSVLVPITIQQQQSNAATVTPVSPQ